MPRASRIFWRKSKTRSRETMETAAPDRTGLVLVDKPAGMTSHDAVAIVRRALRTRRVGHTGTLDPFATGLLVVLVGRGTRLIPYVDGEPKVYEATIRFGAETDTDDLTGETTRQAGPPNDTAIAEAIARLSGEIDQTPPSYSAKKVGGVRAYDAARRGSALSLAAVRVMVHKWELLDRSGADMRVRITCGRGTYIRALARDLGRFADSAAHLTTLRRTKSGPFDVRDAVSVDDIRTGKIDVRPLITGVPSLPAQRLEASDVRRALHGNTVAARVDGPRVALVDDQETLIAVADRVGGDLHPALVLRDA
jgi:tRNA pseudouridine55 synthase